MMQRRLIHAGILAVAGTVLACGPCAMAQVAPLPGGAPAAPQPTNPQVTSEETGKQPAAAAGEQPKFDIERKVQDWGVVTDQDALKGEIKFKNTGKSRLLITEVKPSCGCVRPKLRGDKRQYEPGEEGVLDIAFEPLNRQGETNIHIAIRTNDPTAAVTNIDVKADVKPTVGVESPDGMSLGTFDAGSAKSLTFYIFGVSPDFKATFATISAESGFEVKVGETVEAVHRGDKVRRTPITVTAKDNAIPAKFSHSVVIRHSDKRIKNGLWEATITGEILNDVRPETAELNLGTVAVGEAFQGEIRLTNAKGKPFKVAGIRHARTKGGAFEIETSPVASDKPETMIVRVTGKAPARPGVYEARMQVAVDIKGMPAVQVPVKLLVRDPIQPAGSTGAGAGAAPETVPQTAPGSEAPKSDSPK
jgi:hypothetical protein